MNGSTFILLLNTMLVYNKKIILTSVLDQRVFVIYFTTESRRGNHRGHRRLIYGILAINLIN